MTANKLKNCANGPRASATIRHLRLAIVTALSLPLVNVQAVDRHWTGALDTRWGENANWDTQRPGNADNAVFDGIFTNQPTLTGNQSAGGVWMTGAVGQNVTISAQTDGDIEVLTLNGNTINGTAGLGLLVDNANAFTLTISNRVRINDPQTWRNNSGNLVTISGPVDLNNRAWTVDGTGNFLFSGVIEDDGNVTLAGSGIRTFTGANTYLDVTLVNGGVLNIRNNTALGATVGGTASGTIVASGAELQIQGGITVGTEVLTLNGSGISNTGAFRNISGTNSYAGIITLASSSRINSDSDTLTLSGGIMTGGFTATFGGSSNISETGVISGTGSVAKDGTGTVTLSGANTFTGTTTVNGGTLVAANGTGSALGTTTAITVNSGGTLMLGASNQINNTAPMTLSGGTFAKGNFSEGTISTPGVGALTLTASGSTLDFGTGTVGVLTFASFTPGSFILTIDNWTGTLATQGTASTDRLIFDVSQSANLNSFAFTGFGPGALQFDLGNGFFEIVPATPVPEPSTLIVAALAAGVTGWHLLRRRRVQDQATGPQSFVQARLVHLAVATALLLPVVPAQADNESWTGAVDSRWGDNSNWDPREPGVNDNALFDRLFTNQPELTINTSIGGIWMTGNIVPDVTISSTGDVLTLRESLGLGLLVDNTNGSKLTITTDLKVGSDQSWVNNSNNLVTIAGEVDLNNEALTIAGPGNFVITGLISNRGILPHQDSLTLTGSGSRAFSGANTYDGLTTVNGGVLFIQSDTGLGSTEGGTIVSSGAELQLEGGMTGIAVGQEAITLNGSGTAGGGALQNFNGNNSYGGSIVLGSDSKIGSGLGTLTLNGDLATSGFTITYGGASNIIQSGSITGIGALVKNDAGTVTLNGTNTYVGATTVNGGTLILSASFGGALQATSDVTVNSGGTVLLGADNQIRNAAPITLAGGTFAKGNFSEGSDSTAGVGALTLTAPGSHIDFGNGTVGVLTFDFFAPGAFTLTVDNWTGTAQTLGSASTDRLIFASDQSANLGSFLFTGFAAGAFQFDLGGGFWEVTPVPEPSTWAGAGLAAAVMGWYLVRRRRIVTCPVRRVPMFTVTCGVALLATTAFATPRDEISRAVAVNTQSDVSEATQGEFLKAFTAVALRVPSDELPAYLTAAIELRPDLAPKAVTVAVKVAAKHGELKPQNLPTAIGKIMKAAIAAKPEAVVSIAEAGAAALPHLRHYVVNAAIAAAPHAKEAIINAINHRPIPRAFLTMSATHTDGLWFTSATLNPANISEPVVSAEQPPSN